MPGLQKANRWKTAASCSSTATDNEPVGVNDFIKLLQSKTQSIAGKQWLLYDLRDSIDQEFEGN